MEVDVDELEEFLNERQWIAPDDCKVIWYNDRRYPLVIVKGIPRIQLRLSCAECHKRYVTVYVGYGAPGWCYAYSKRGDYCADLRNQEYVCRSCSIRRRRGTMKE